MPSIPRSVSRTCVPSLAIVLALTLSCTEDAARSRQTLYDVEPPRLLADAAKYSLAGAEVVAGQTVYIPCYSQVLTQRVPGEASRRPLAVSLSLRNTDGEHPIVLRAARYFASDGSLLRDLLADGPVVIEPMGTVTHAIAQVEREGGEGANFVVEWVSLAPVSQPLFEAVMTSSSGAAAMAFTSRGVVIDAL